MLQLYRTVLMQQLEYHVQFWSPHDRKDVEASKWVQKMAGLGLSNKERFDKPGLFSLEWWWLRGDMIELLNILKDLDKVENQNFFSSVKMSKPRVPLANVTGYFCFYTQR